jgi:hypothetical protein
LPQLPEQFDNQAKVPTAPQGTVQLSQNISPHNLTPAHADMHAASWQQAISAFAQVLVQARNMG